jgi:hypothetical protein
MEDEKVKQCSVCNQKIKEGKTNSKAYKNYIENKV